MKATPEKERWNTRVNKAKDYVRNNLSEDLNLDQVARAAYSSPYHFHPIFKAICGETVAEFTRRARLERAAYLMKAAPGRSLNSIALEVGFPALAEFSRAFKRHYGLPPSSWDRITALNRETDSADQILSTHYTSHDFEAHVVHHQACRLAYLRMQTWFQVEDLKVGFDQLTRWLEKRNVEWREQPMVGMSWDHYQTTPLNKVNYDLAFHVPIHIQGEGSVGTYDLPSVSAVEVHCQGPLSRIAEAWDYLYDEWFVNSAYEPADLPAMKRFCRRPDETGWNHWDLKCSIAIARGSA